ncbi:ATP-binding protein [Aureimonas jatrophae]|uniref:AAA domain-containing protein n=1 Tax=Aureimonas jatrophae TaxID=1166073 RepID=A0A1H0M2Y3_9HYPH|nr:ATP-binding protein [Aureimonas jatrophae]MBB3952653.1 hypothetical protein [Aureimonas jatrophae]SDO74530.1 AAA domain-containing protein [Aureimonas jatrophae]
MKAPKSDSGDHVHPEAPDIASIVSARRGAGRQAVLQTMSRVRSGYLPTRRDVILAREFAEFLDDVLVQREDGTRDDGRCFFVTGESGAGKSSSIRRLLAAEEALAPVVRQGRTYVPWVSVKGPSPGTLQRLGLRICREIGYPAKVDTPENRIWEILGEQLRMRGVLVVHIDEAQHLARSMQSEYERKNVANTFKDVLENKAWPISFVLSGIPIATEIARTDEQIERRGRFLSYPSLDLDVVADRRIVLDMIELLAVRQAELDIGGIPEGDLPDRIAHAANYEIGRVAQVIAGAIHKALLRGEGVLAGRDFVTAHRSVSHTRGLDHLNPFVAEDWRTLQAGSFLIQSGC